MESPRTCPQCLQPLASDAPDGLCPPCLLKAAAGPPPSASKDGLDFDIIDIADSAEVAKKLPQFEILEMLGRGGMGVVYRARQKQLDRMVAIKILPPVDALSPDFVARFTREARSLARLNHPNIVNVHDFGEAGGLYYIVMELVEGANLRELFEARKLTAAEALAIVPKICDALQYAHEEGIVHRDVKPENILIHRKGRVKIADFGLAKLLRREALDLSLTLSGVSLGTVRYMAPEQMDQPETVDHRADLYSLGVIIYEMLTGEVPIGRYQLPSQKAQVDVRLDDIVLHALEREPARRYQHASEVRDDVEKVTSTAGTKAPESRSPEGAAPRLSRLALWGAIWAPFVLMIGLPEAVFFEPNQLPHRGLLADLAQQRPAWFVALNVFLLLAGGSAPFGTTILGAVAIGKIRRSGGQLYGHGLAMAEALLFPAVVLFCLVALIANAILARLSLVDLRTGNPFGVLIAAAVLLLVGRAVWRRRSG